MRERQRKGEGEGEGGRNGDEKRDRWEKERVTLTSDGVLFKDVRRDDSLHTLGRLEISYI
jgi:hypothetical protein